MWGAERREGNMRAAFPFLPFLSGCCMTWTEALTVNGVVGGTVRIECNHFIAASNYKYLCKGECREKDVLISSKTGGSDKYSIEDNGNTFITTIRDLRLEDTGTYWCGIDRAAFDTFVEVYLKVNDVGKSDVHAVEEAITTGFKPTARPTDFENESSRGESTSDQWTYRGAALGVAVLVLALVLLIFCRIKRRRAAFVSDKNQSTNECPGDPRRNSLLLASLTNPHPDSAIYSNVSGFPKPQDQPDERMSVPSSREQPGFFYSTVNYNNDSKGVALLTYTDSVIYSTITMTQ